MKKICILVLCALMVLSGCSIGKGQTKTALLYFVNENKSQLIEEKREVRVTGKNFMQDVVNALLEGPTIPGAQSVISKDTKLLDVTLKDKIAYVNMSESFDIGEDSDKLLRRYTLISTLCSIDGVDKTKILVEGKEIRSISGDKKALEPLGKEDIVLAGNEQSNNRYSFKLYFCDINGNIKAETQDVEVKEGEMAEKIVVEHLIAGPKTKGLYPTLNSKTKLLGVEVKEHVCFVNFGSNFISGNSGGSTQEMLAVYSIVDSLCELSGIDKVQFLIEGKSKPYFGQIVFNEPFESDRQ